MFLKFKSSKSERVFTVILLLILTTAIILISQYRFVLTAVALFLSTLSIYELYSAAGYSITEKKNLLMYILSWLVMIPLCVFRIPFYFQICCVIFFLYALFSALLMIKPQLIVFDKAWKIILLAFVVVFLFQSIQMVRLLDYGFYYLTLPIVVCALTDSFAYVWGSSCGKHKLCPKISPNKTVEGALGGFLTCVIVIMLFGVGLKFFLNLNIRLLWLLVVTMTASVVSMFGDLAMSIVKRICGIKDYGSLLPGHGGILDRFDSHLMTIPFVYILCVFFPIIDRTFVI